jgi:hypothetical protein
MSEPRKINPAQVADTPILGTLEYIGSRLPSDIALAVLSRLRATFESLAECGRSHPEAAARRAVEAGAKAREIEAELIRREVDGQARRFREGGSF